MKGRVSASTQNQALNAIVFLYRDVLELELDKIEAVRARRLRASRRAELGPPRRDRTALWPLRAGA